MLTPTTATRDGKQSDRRLNPGLQQHSSTAYFDGLGGILSFIVFVRHFLLLWKADLDTGFGQDGVYETTAMSYLKLPLIRLIYSGPTVPIFLLMFGFFLSYRHLGLIRQGDMHGFSLSMMSAVLRRPFRLYLPPVVAAFLVALTVHFDLYTCTYDGMTGPLPRRSGARETLTPIMGLVPISRGLAEPLELGASKLGVQSTSVEFSQAVSGFNGTISYNGRPRQVACQSSRDCFGYHATEWYLMHTFEC